VNKTAALLLAGLVTVNVANAQEKPLLPPGAPPSPSEKQASIQKIKSGEDYVTLNFTNIDITALVKVMSELMRKNFILDERVTGKVTLMTPTRISPDEAYQVFLSALEIKGFTAIEDGKIIRIIPAASARQSGLKVFRDEDFKGEGFVTKLFRLSFVAPQEVVRTLTPLVSKDGSLIPYPATSSLIITDSVSNIRKIESLIRLLDVPAPEGKGKINVYYLKNGNSEDFAKVMSALVARLPAPPPGGAAQQAGPATILEGAVTITSDKATNSLIIVASPGDYETVKDVIQKLDIRRRQVYVEAAIIEMSLSKSRDLGFEFQATNLHNLDTSTATTAVGGTNFGNIGNVIANGPAGLAALNGLTVGAIKGTFTFKGVQFLNVGALLHALQNDSDVNVLSTPNILTTDNQKAEIMVGENIPFITGQSQTAATGGGAILTSVDRKDVGITLKLTPQITSDDNVRLEVYQEISDIINTPGLNANVVGPSTSKRSATTTVVIKDRQTMVIGGLIRDNVTSSTSKVPFLGDIPILGWLFKTKQTTVEKTNLMIFITPYIVKNEEDVAGLTRKKGEALENFRDKYGIEKKDMGGLIESKKPVPAPIVTAPTATAPAVSAPTVTAPAVSAPTGTAPAVSAPAGTAPAVTAPTGTTPSPAKPAEETGAPEKTETTAPVQSAPTGTTQTAPPEGVR
jgi:general secretion pathway protein D